jgi:Domain of unknown function (DUF4331)
MDAAAIRSRSVALATSAALAALALLILLIGPSPKDAGAASHREAPLIALDPAADISDFFMFRSYEAGKADRLVMIMDVLPGQEPSSGPNYFNFDPSVVYSFHLDNDRDGNADDVSFDITFDQSIEGLVNQLKLPLSYVGGVGPIPPIDSLDSPGLGLRQTYSVTMDVGDGKPQVVGQGLRAVPSNVGPRTTPNYESELASEGVNTIDGGIRVFAGQRDDPFYIDLGAVFDSLNLRTLSSVGGVDMLSGFNVSSIVLEVPISVVSNGSTVLGGYASTSRSHATIRGKEEIDKGKLVQVQRLANPLVNELIIGTVDKDRWNATEPEDEAQFFDYYLKPRAALALQLASGVNTGCTPFGDAWCSPNPPAPAADLALSNFNRTDLVNILLKYNGVLYGAGDAGTLSDLLRLNLNVPPTPLGGQNRMGVLGGDLAGWPNGRRPGDDVTDIAVEAVGGPTYIGLGVGDGVSANDDPLPTAFPFVSTPADGRNRQPNPHANP